MDGANFKTVRIECPVHDDGVVSMSWRIFTSLEKYKKGEYEEILNSTEFIDSLEIELDLRYGKKYYYTSKPFYNDPEIDVRTDWEIPALISDNGNGYSVNGVIVVTPDITCPNLELIKTQEVDVLLSDFAIYSGVGKHHATNIYITDVNGNVVYSKKNITEDAIKNKVTIGPIPHLEMDKIYILKGQFGTDNNNFSNMASKVFIIREFEKYNVVFDLEDFKLESYAESNFLRLRHKRTDHVQTSISFTDKKGNTVAEGIVSGKNTIVEIVKTQQLYEMTYSVTAISSFSNSDIEVQQFDVVVDNVSMFRRSSTRPFVNALVTIDGFSLPFKTGDCQSEEIHRWIPLYDNESNSIKMSHFDEEDIIENKNIWQLNLPEHLAKTVERNKIMTINDAFVGVSVLKKVSNGYERYLYLVHFNKYTGALLSLKEIGINSYSKTYPGFITKTVNPKYRQDDNIEFFIADTKTIGVFSRDESVGYLDFLFISTSGKVSHVYFDKEFANQALPAVVNYDEKFILLVFNDRKVLLSTIDGEETYVLQPLSSTNVHDNAIRKLVNRKNEIVIYTLDNNSIPISMVLDKERNIWTNRKILNSGHLSVPSVIELSDGDVLSYNTRVTNLVGEKLT